MENQVLLKDTIVIIENDKAIVIKVLPWESWIKEEWFANEAGIPYSLLVTFTPAKSYLIQIVVQEMGVHYLTTAAGIYPEDHIDMTEHPFRKHIREKLTPNSKRWV